MLRALTSTLLIAGVFYAPLSIPYSYAYENAIAALEGINEETTTPEEPAPADEPLASSSSEALLPAETVATSTPEEPVVRLSSDEPALLPTGVLFDNSLADEVWGIGVYYPPGNYAYFPGGYTEIGNPPTVSPEGFWTTTGTTTVARVKRAGADTTCSNLSWGGTYGLSVFTPDFASSFDTNPYATRTVGEYCDFVFYGEGIPPGTALGAVFLGANYMSVAGSSNNPGTSLTGTYENPLPGGFAFQLCGVDGCSGGFATTTATTTPGVATTTPQVSNVLFLPGIKGSRLYDAVGNKVWEPGSDQDVEKLFLTSAGVSANPGIHTKSGDIIERIAGFSEIYGSFIRSMNELQSTEMIKEWRIASYDWRLSLDDIVNKGAVREGNIYFEETANVPYLELNLLELASSSPTHKVTIIAHSNGGLVAKKLLMKLGDAETARLIDKVIFVGVPQSGAPQALGALLFGYKESLPSWFPFVVHVSTARMFAENSPMGYHLLPSQRYFDDLLDQERAVVRFTAASTYAEERAKYGNVIDTWDELRAFSLAEDNGRVKPEAVLFFKPNVLNDLLLTYAKRTHDSLDAWVPPAGVTLYQVGGWGLDTVSGIEFYELCILSVCKKEYRPTFVQDGDGVVPIASALMISTSTENVRKYWLDLIPYEFGPINKDHGSILAVKELQDLLEAILGGDSNVPKNVYTEQPTSSTPNKLLRFMLHSPLTLNLYDTSGNHTGPTASGGSEQTIPGSVYGQFGEVQYVIVPAGPEYRVEMNGVSTGTFSLDIQEVFGGSIVASTTLAGVPTQAGTIARITIGESLATASSLSVDSDGNGAADFVLPVSQNSISFYQTPVKAVTVATSSGGSSRSRTLPPPITETIGVNAVPLLGLPGILSAPQLTKKIAQTAEATQGAPVVATRATDENQKGNKSQLASPLLTFYEVKYIFISLLAGVYHFIIRIGSFLFAH